ncbi:Lrp/AsnC ligand binding domain-containing protein [Candidatus Bipolaricaulota bacterium]|nr:Lrp/AsnC ligand binding domain-containing protein [Candidatus Bipolaricaulota bacterium]
MQLLDTTLREGEQTPGVSFSIEEKKEIARKLDEFGVDIIELGHPVVSGDIEKACRVISGGDLKAETMAHSRALKEDIDMASDIDVDWVGIFLGTSQLSLEHKLHIDRTGALEKIRESVSYAKDRDFKVRFTPEDATRTDPGYLEEAIVTATEAGADRISIADTVGTATPFSYGKLIEDVIRRIDIPVHTHCHNDYGMAVANSLSGFGSGAYLIDVTVNGLGERTGIAPLAPVVVALSRLYDVDNDWNLDMLPEISRTVEKASGLFNSETEPIVGEHAFAHKSGLHTKAVLENPETYEAIPPEIVQKHREIIIDKYTGKAAVKDRLTEMGVEPDEDQLREIVSRVKGSEAGGKTRFTDIDLLEIADDILDLDIKSRIPAQVEALISFSLNSSSYTTRATRKIASFEEVATVFELTGDKDIQAHLESSSVQQLNDLIEEFRNMDEVQTTETSLILKGYEEGEN